MIYTIKVILAFALSIAFVLVVMPCLAHADPILSPTCILLNQCK